MVISVNAPKAVEEEEPILAEGEEGAEGAEGESEDSSEDSSSTDAEGEGSEES